MRKRSETVLPIAVADFSRDMSGANPQMDARDSSLRTRSTDFGNFIADAIQAATSSELTIINSGSFRADSTMSPIVTDADLREVFIYDRADAISVVHIDGEELRSFHTHAKSKSGEGAFLQVSAGYGELLKGRGSLKLAIATYLLADDEDQYQSILARSRGCRPSEVLSRMVSADTVQGGIRDLVIKGARLVAYSNEIRVGGNSEIETDDVKIFIKLVDEYLARCRAEGMSDYEALLFRDPLTIRPHARASIQQARFPLREFAVSRVKANLKAIDAFLVEFSHDLAQSKEAYERELPYADYFDAAVKYDWAKRHVLIAFD